jgi:DNA-binding response OmpR family regulator
MTASVETSSKKTPATRVLVVDDEPKLRESLAEGLRLEDWTVVTAENGTEALERLRADSFDLLVLDWMLPDIDGLEILRRIRPQAPRLPVLMVTARNMRSDQVAALECGATDYVTKPFAFDELIARCRALLAPEATAAKKLSYRDAELDLTTRILRLAGTEIALSEIETALLEALLRNPQDFTPIDLLARQVWKDPGLSLSLQPAVEIQM